MQPSEATWSVKQILAHLSSSERFRQHWFADMIMGSTPGQYGGNPTALPEVLGATLNAAPTVEALLARLEDDFEETLVLFNALRPEIVAMKARYRAMASSLLAGFHLRDHIAQIRRTIAAISDENTLN